MTSDVSYAVWALCALGVLVLWALSRWQSADVARPLAATRVLMAQPAPRLALGLGYMWLGWHLFAR
jgi:hypothetical protein